MCVLKSVTLPNLIQINNKIMISTHSEAIIY